MTSLPTFEFHVSRAARDRYAFSDRLWSSSGNVVFPNVAACREFARKMNQAHPEQPVHPGALNAMGLIDEALHMVMARYREQRDPSALLDALAWFQSQLGREALDHTLLAFADLFPTAEVYRGRQSAAEWLSQTSGAVPHRAIVLEEIIMLWLANLNPAFQDFQKLFDQRELASSTSYNQLTSGLRQFFQTRPRFGPDNQNLVDMLRAPALAAPDSLAGQLSFIREHWANLLGEFLDRLLTGVDILKEEEIATWLRFHPPAQRFGAPMLGDSSAAAVPHFSDSPQEYERFSPDVDWMPRTVLMAKSVYVWLDQLSKSFRREIHTLDQIPEEELLLLARRGFNALWLIGIWERSRASRRIKQMMGNPEAAASAYSLYDYAIAGDLGGEAALDNLKQRAWNHGIRLASDMVPNHMGIDSRWVIEHPDWFLSLPYSPFPSYSFNGPDVGEDSRVEIKVEDHYFDRSDAAVVFRRRDQGSEDRRFLYHGNDGTSFPWNDTAQLDYLKPEVREAVMQTILQVARRFPIIRFDAAMTLTKQHYQRLWFPAPGTGGAIPSRAEQGMTKAQFDAAMPREFWRELVDRVAAEAPGTLLLAEAFWLLEGYFVRTLGMHRVYNSAFMNMLRDEENANYRRVLKNTLEFDPEVLKRYVNFMNNPDERTAVDQFGKGDKYFGVCTLLATLPGLPMFGHGQIEGFAERYGMEYRRAYHQESADSWLVARHERDISPLLHRRALFAEVKDFLLYDFFTEDGRVNEDVFAFSNRLGDQRALVVYNNRYAHTAGWIRGSCSFALKAADGARQLCQRTLGEGLGLSDHPAMFAACRDALTGLEFLHRARDLCSNGLRLELGGYHHAVYLDWRDIRDDGRHPWSALCDELGGRGVSSLEDALVMLELKPVHNAMRRLLDPELATALALLRESPPSRTVQPVPPVEFSKLINQRARVVMESAQQFLLAVGGDSTKAVPLTTGGRDGREGQEGGAAIPSAIEHALGHFEGRVAAALQLPHLGSLFTLPWTPEASSVLPTGPTTVNDAIPLWQTLLAWCLLEALGVLHNPGLAEAASAELFDKLRLRAVLAEALAAPGSNASDTGKHSAGTAQKDEAMPEHDAAEPKDAAAPTDKDEPWRAAARIRATFAAAAAGQGRPMRWLHDPDIAWLIGVNEYEGVRYLVKEQFERLLWWLALPKLLDLAAQTEPDLEAVRALERQVQLRMNSLAQNGYRVEALMEN